MNFTNTANEVVVVDNAEGLNALPVGAELELASKGLFVRKSLHGYFTWSRGDLDGKGHITVKQMTASSGWIPATVTNPEILGTFHKPNSFKAGDRVVKTTKEHFIARGSEGYDYGEEEAPKGAAGTVTEDVSAFGANSAVHVDWDEGLGSVISPDNLGFEPRLGDKVRITEGSGCGVECGDAPTGTLVRRHESPFADDKDFADHPYGVKVPEFAGFTYLAKNVEVVDRVNLSDWEIELLYPEKVEEPEPEVDENALKAGDKVRIEVRGNRPYLDKWNGFEVEIVEVNSGFMDMSYVKALSPRPDGASLTKFFWDTVELVKVEEPVDPTLITTLDDLEALPMGSVITFAEIPDTDSPHVVTHAGIGRINRYNPGRSYDETRSLENAVERGKGVRVLHRPNR